MSIVATHHLDSEAAVVMVVVVMVVVVKLCTLNSDPCNRGARRETLACVRRA